MNLDLFSNKLTSISPTIQKKSLKKYELSHQQKFQKIFPDEIRINICQKSGKVKLE